MTNLERRMHAGHCVNDWEGPRRFIRHFFPIIRNRFEMFIAEQPLFAFSVCEFHDGSSVEDQPCVYIQFRKHIGQRIAVLTQQEETDILTFVNIGLMPDNRNLKAVQTEHSPFHFAFAVRVKTHLPFSDRQRELDIFGPFGGNGSPPDRNKNQFLLPPAPWKPPHQKSKNTNQFLVDLGPFCCGNSMSRWQIYPPPKVIFSEIDPVDEDKLPLFDHPLTPPRRWLQPELGLPPSTPRLPPLIRPSRVEAPPVPQTQASFFRRIFAHFLGFWRKLFS